jgi:branched-chain amino acid transport system ATP-binding protein
MSALLEVRDLAKAYGGVHAVRGVSLSVASGEIVALIGPNGAGKSTCFNALNGQIRPDAGTIRLNGRDIAGWPPRDVWRLGVGRTFQITATFASMSVIENVQMVLLSHARRAARLWGLATRAECERAEALLALVSMLRQAERPSAELAYGDLKRLELAMALANEPRLLLMDEPTAGMSPRDRVELMALTAGIAREKNLGVLFTEHDMDVVFRHADRILVLSRGQLIAEGRPDEVRRNPEVQAVYLGEGLTYHDGRAR